mmetsp:Transcript_18756/g.16606  ORF Transcript_18756/g.16606 Transcript_18756/m.16606 type:complete len:192 (+) Transcript_18756:237-812(+)
MKNTLMNNSLRLKKGDNVKLNPFFKLRKQIGHKVQKSFDATQQISIKVANQRTWQEGGKLNTSKDSRNAYDDFSELTVVAPERNKSVERIKADNSSISFMTRSYNKQVNTDLSRWTIKRRRRSKIFEDVDISKIFRDIDRQIAIAKLLSSKEDHIKIDSLIEKTVDLLPEIPIYIKIPCKDEYSPCKVSIK